uniref:GRF-type domain-containing protein n=1 Tax=Arundo donax TaxID=35708 RepID=A0A0A8YRZ9_ARUDO
MATSAAGSSSRARLRSRFASQVIPIDSLSLIECLYHPERKVVRLTANTTQNRGRRFYRCMKNARVWCVSLFDFDLVFSLWIYRCQYCLICVVWD